MSAEWFDGAIAGWWGWIAATTLQASALFIVAWVIDRFCVRRAWPQVLATMWWLALARLVLPPTFSSPVSITDSVGASTLDAAAVTPSAMLLHVSFVVWSAGVIAVLAARSVRRRRLATELRCDVSLSREWSNALQSCAAILGLHRAPPVATLEGLESPAVFGAWRPTLLLPRAPLHSAPTRRDRHALLHEMAHVRRRDLVFDELRALLCALFWFHPLVWIASSRLHQLSELACDARVARVLADDATSYRDTLVLAARDVLAPRSFREMRAFLGRPATLLLRIEQLERRAQAPLALVRASSAVLALVFVACVLPMAPRVDAWRTQALRVFELERAGVRQSCFTLHAAAQVLAASSDSPLSLEKR